jgi:DNA-binding MarR family transcriptional regulator
MSATSEGTLEARRFSSPQEEALLSLMRSADCLQRAFQQKLKPSGLTATQYNVLRILRGTDPKGLTCSAIGKMMITPEPDITRLLGRLKTQDLVTQQRDQHDRRAIWNHITPLGLSILKDLDGIVEQAPRDLLGGLNCTEVTDLIRLLGKASCCSQPNEAPLTGKPSSPHRQGKFLPHHRPE